MIRFLKISILTLSIISCVSEKREETSLESIQETNDNAEIVECLLYGHSNRIDGMTGATLLINEPKNKKEKIIKDIFSLPELHEIQSVLSASGSKDFVAISICDIGSNPFEATCIIDNYYQDSLIFRIEIDTIDMIFKKIN